MTTVRLQLENSTYNALKKYAKEKKLTIQQVIHNLVDQLNLDNTHVESDTPSWKKPLPEEITNIMPKRKKVSFSSYDEYKAEIEKRFVSEA